ncbi:MAG: hypothetical protein IKQ99_01780 [Alphaproteobacteria bacterium]|nr:hypothetical protein [Alphaproteobacteria bacterium]
MFGKIIKNKVLSFLLSVAAISPFAHAKDASKPFENLGTTNDIFLKEYQQYARSNFTAEDAHPLDEYTQTLVIDNEMPFYIPSSDKELPPSKSEQLPLSMVKTQKLDIGGTPWLIMDDENTGVSKAQQEIDELLAIPEDPKLLEDKENAQKLKEEAVALLHSLGTDKTSQSSVVQQQDMAQLLSLTETFPDKSDTVEEELHPKKLVEQKEISTNVSEVVVADASETTPAKVVEQLVFSTEIPEVQKEEIIPTVSTEKPRAVDSLTALRDLDRAVESLKNEPELSKGEPEQPASQPHPKTPDEKEVMYIMFGIMLGGVSLGGLSCLPKKYPFEDDYILAILNGTEKEKHFRRYYSEDDYFRSIVNEAMENSSVIASVLTDKTNKQIYPIISSKQDVIDAEAIFLPEKPVKQLEKSVVLSGQHLKIEDLWRFPFKDERAMERWFIATKILETNKRKSDLSVNSAMNNKRPTEPVISIEKSHPSNVNITLDIPTQKNRDAMMEWLIAAKILEEIKNERAVLRKEMAVAKTQPDNEAEIARITARRNELSKKRRMLCYCANREEMWEIKEKRRLLTNAMTRAKRRKNEQMMEKIKRARSALRKKVKQMNTQLTSFNYSQDRKDYLKISRQMSSLQKTK